MLKSQTPHQSNYCSGYVDAMIEHKMFLENQDFFNCFSTYRDFDPFKAEVMKLLIEEVKNSENQYVRSYKILDKIIDKQFQINCKKEN